MKERQHTLPEDKRDCSFCGGPLVEVTGQTENSGEITLADTGNLLACVDLRGPAWK